MSFAAPLVLLALAALPLLAVWYLLAQRNRRAAGAAFASPRMQPAVAPSRPGWRRHAPMLVFLVALAALIVAAAKPQRTVAVPVERASIVLLTDVSGSMLATDVQPNRMIAAKRAARRFVDEVPKAVNIGVIAYNTTATVLQSPTRDRADIATAIDRLTVSGTTATGDAIRTATTVLRNQPGVDGRRPPSAIVLISDGVSVRGSDPIAAASEAAALRIPIYTVAFGTDAGTITVPDPRTGEQRVESVPPDPASLAQIAEVSNGDTFTAASSDRLNTVYERLGSQLGTRDEQRQITAAFAAGGLLLLLAGAGLSLRWFGRPI
ncbi:VWA domain-containing protein [Conexibacter sp. CPCC 206217]|uniref:VWA domain-containing protein n=1 Tax=Conexibacter sp. CPCC 206217 TaxID=3064574 RepID=UPI00271C5D5C|nr:VWA domain-containing protein [Conexibacter sp. CPCC 206217]MDO8213367.1 VWA domain-containing protein [Conexibacter sp. CPCC 206217]